MKQTEWKIIYSSPYEGVVKRAVHLLSKEAGKLLIREEGVYRIYVLPCEKEGCDVSKNAFFIGRYEDSPTIQKYVSAEEIKPGGHLVKVVRNPEIDDGRFVLLTAHSAQELFYAVVSFLDNYIPLHAPFNGSNQMPRLIFDAPLPEYCRSEAPDRPVRSIFTWGHSFNDYRGYIDNMARARFNELIIWNNHVPVNISDIIDYAHSYGIRIVLGYSWGWKDYGHVAQITDEEIAGLKRQIIQEYLDDYAPLRCDGIYFQSFTERQDESIGEKLIARIVTDMVNDVAESLWKITPDLRLIFGLHATSVKNRLEEIARVHPRIEILWEDCGEFPYAYDSFVHSEERFQETLDFTRKLLELRGGVGVGLVFKGVMMLDWTRFVTPSGPYVMGENSADLSEHDRRVRAQAWRIYSAAWMQNGEYAARMLRFVQENRLSDVNLCLAGTFDGGLWLPLALCGEMFYSLHEEYLPMLSRVARRECITVD